MRNTARVGNGFEKVVERHLTAKGWVLASRRHIAGPGDLLAVHGSYPDRRRLIEVKATKTPWSGFPPAERIELVEFCAVNDLIPELAWKNEAGGITFLPMEDWPTA